jgi:hypothetical protein
MRLAALSLALFGLCASVPADVTVQCPAFRAQIGADARWQSLRAADGRELLAPEGPRAIATVRQGGRSFEASSAELTGTDLSVRFTGTDTVLRYQVHPADRWVVLKLTAVEGTRPEQVTLLQVPVGITAHLGRMMGCAWDERTAVGLLAANRQTDIAHARGTFCTLRAVTQDGPGPKLEGAACALMVCPRADLESTLRDAGHAFGLLTNEDRAGTPARDTDLPRGSYWFFTFGEADVDRVIALCEQSGLRQVLISSGSWCQSVGHYLFNDSRFPRGKDSLKTVVDKLHAHGILVGMHCFASKVSKADPYVTPVPDKRFLKDMQASLAEPSTADQTRIRVAEDLSQWPGSPVCRQKTWEGGVAKHQEVVIGDEIIQYQSIGPEGKWDTFEGCKRGAWGTSADAHPAGQAAYHYAVDGCINGYIIDQETTLLAETSDRLAGIFRDCGFDMVYFDGGEDVDKRRFNYYSANFQEQCLTRFDTHPVLHMGTVRPHVLWHSFCRVGTVDTYLNTIHGNILAGAPPEKWPTVRDHINTSVRHVIAAQDDLIPGELGWFGIWPRSPEVEGLQLDEVEYLMAKSVAYDAPISLETGFSQMEAHPLTPAILELVRAYEERRMARAVPGDVQEALKPLDADFALLRWEGRDHFVPVNRAEGVAGAPDVHAMVGAFGDGSLATLWHVRKQGQLFLPLPATRLRAVDVQGAELPVIEAPGGSLVGIGPRRTALVARGISPEALSETLRQAELRLTEPTRLFLRATDYTDLVGEMVRGETLGVSEPEALGEVLLSRSPSSPSAPRDWYAQYTVQIPHAGRWAIWARVRYPSGSDDSFFFAPAGDSETLGTAQTLGNCGATGRKWHWTGQGSGTAAAPPGKAIVLSLPQGPFTFRICPREAAGTAELSPRLDALCLCDDPDEVPTDAQARAALAPCPARL